MIKYVYFAAVGEIYAIEEKISKLRKRDLVCPGHKCKQDPDPYPALSGSRYLQFVPTLAILLRNFWTNLGQIAQTFVRGAKLLWNYADFCHIS